MDFHKSKVGNIMFPHLIQILEKYFQKFLIPENITYIYIYEIFLI